MNRINYDTHLHSSLSFDSDCPMEDLIKSGINKQLKGIYITEHYDLDFPKEYNMDFTFDIYEYFKSIKNFQKEFSNEIELYSGIELGLMPHLNQQINSLINDYSFDYIIGSTHIIDNKDPYYPQYWEGRNIRDSYISYFITSLDNIQNINNFDAFGHLDYISRYDTSKTYNPRDYIDYIDEILSLLIEKDKALEINSAGLRKNLSTTNPDLFVIKRYKELGGSLITVGSDSHDSTNIAYGFNLVANLLLEAGFKHYNIYINRTPYEKELV